MRDPTRQRPYLADPNYYRLGFQLAAQLLNLAADRHGAIEAHRLRTEAAQPEPQALEVATLVLADCGQMLDWLAFRRDVSRWRRPLVRRPRRPDDKLGEFLAQTVEPCTRIAAAVSLHELGDVRRAQAQADRVIVAARDDRVSYRAHYSLACWFGRVAGEAKATVEMAEAALAHLATALNRAPRDRAFDLADWARRDPSLAIVQEAPTTAGHFMELVGSFKRPHRATSPPDRRG